MRRAGRILPGITILCMLFAAASAGAADGGLLFHVSADGADDPFVADYSLGNGEPTFIYNVASEPGGASGKYFNCGHKQLMAYDAPGNIFAQRGTLAFFWRPGTPVGDVPFPIFRVSYADHSSWDYVWLRIDYNGNGFDAFVTDANLARVRVSNELNARPAPDKWMHFALAWDENEGIRFYLDGRLIGRVDTTAVFDAGLDQFGPHSRIISPYQVQSLYNYERGGDIDEICIFDHMLDETEVGRLAGGTSPMNFREAARMSTLDDPETRSEWYLRYGWNRPGDTPPMLDAVSTVARKVEVHDVFDLKQWWWKGTDGIRETTWPGVYNRSRLPGRSDYFLLPDWNCYSKSGKSVTFYMPDEQWNHLELAGAAYGDIDRLWYDKEGGEQREKQLFVRPEGQERTFHRFDNAFTGGKVRLTNVEQETPLGEFLAYNVNPGTIPPNSTALTYYLRGNRALDNPVLDDLASFIDGRYMPAERSVMLALPGGNGGYEADEPMTGSLPIVHVLVPFEFRAGNLRRTYTRSSYTWENINAGLDGIELTIPALDLEPTHDGLIPLNVTVRDPLWPHRRMFDFTFSVRPGEQRVLFMDTRDRILPEDHSLYLTIASASGGFGPGVLEGARLRLVFKDRDSAKEEHVVDRFTQVKDNVANFVEEYPNIKKLRTYDRYSRDIRDLLRVNPDHDPGRYYWTFRNQEQGWPEFTQPKPPAGVPLWAFRQVEAMKLVDHWINWWIDNRQIENGEFGGGLSDDSDFTNYFVGPALMGITPDKITDSIAREIEAIFDNGMFTDGLNTIVTDELHVYEEGINVLPQNMMLQYGDPKVVERLMDTAKNYERITGINDLGERQIKSTFFGAEKIYEHGVWAKQKTNYSWLILQDGLSLVEFNGHPATKKLLLEVADGLLAHRKKDAQGNYYLPHEIMYPSGEDTDHRGLGPSASVFWACWKWTDDDRYLLPIKDELDRGNYRILQQINANMLDLAGLRDEIGDEIEHRTSPHGGDNFLRGLAWQVTGDKQYLEEMYADLIQRGTQMMYINTEGHLWSDRVTTESRMLQRERLGGRALWRNNLYPGHHISWRFHDPATYQSVAILIPDATKRGMTIIARNMEPEEVTATMTTWDIDPGTWRMTIGTDTDGDDTTDTITDKRKIDLERTSEVDITFPANATTVITLERAGGATAYWKRPDLGIGLDDVRVSGRSVQVTVHSLGSVDAPAGTVALVDASGDTVATAQVPKLAAPLDYKPKTAQVTLTVPSGTDTAGAYVIVNPDGKNREITMRNNTIRLADIQ